jgi:hypothetical protein
MDRSFTTFSDFDVAVCSVFSASASTDENVSDLSQKYQFETAPHTPAYN